MMFFPAATQFFTFQNVHSIKPSYHILPFPMAKFTGKEEGKKKEEEKSYYILNKIVLLTSKTLV
jgi:hypothetical protein